MIEFRDFYKCSFCGLDFGMRSDSNFCNTICQTKAAAKIESVCADRVYKPIRSEKEIYDSFLEEKIPMNQFAEKWDRYRRLQRMKG